MNQRLIQTLTVLTLLISLSGCSNPADGVTEAQVNTTTNPPSADPSSAEAQVYKISTENSSIGFEGSKVTGSHAGGFKVFSGQISLVDGKISAGSQIEIDMLSTWSDSDKLTTHLKNRDFFDVPRFPTSIFEATGMNAGTEGSTLTGNLTLHGVTKEISFPATVEVTDTQVSLTAEFYINRRDFDINYAGRANDLIRDEVVITLNVLATNP